jgi:hypothetical protein
MHEAPAIDKKSGAIQPRGTMTERRETPHLTPARQAEQAARDKRLAAALRANLQRRKEQARARTGEKPVDISSPEASKR